MYHQLTSLEKYRKLVDYALNKKARIGFDSCSASSFIKCVKGRQDFDQLNQMVDSCESTSFSYYVNANGIGFPCSFCEGEKGFKGINILKAKDFIRDVWNAKETVKFRNRLVSNKDCNGCRQCPTFDLEVK